MATSTTGNYNPGRYSDGSPLPPLNVAADIIIHEGHMVTVATDGAGVAEPAEIAANRRLVGISKKTVDNQGGSAGDVQVETETGDYSWDMLGGDTFDNGDVGATAYVHNSYTVKKTAGSNSIVAGIVRGIAPDGRVIVRSGV